ncbi:MAG: hypothetical protein EBU16_01450, partial [Actinobacteria bacterium]|nr:hypothetical protein [Actinomycetota bacterium]
FWVDFDEAYWTMSPEYIESVWWSLQQIWKKGLLPFNRLHYLLGWRLVISSDKP